MKQNWMKTKKSVFFARLKKWAACLWPTSGRRQILRLSLLKKQGLSSTPSRAKTVLIRVKKIISVANKKSVKFIRRRWNPC
jgi:ribosomal protein L17